MSLIDPFLINSLNFMNLQPITEGNYFHIYNRGVNGENIFKEEKNYYFFLAQYKKYCAPVFETLAYALLKNHFHFNICKRKCCN